MVVGEERQVVVGEGRCLIICAQLIGPMSGLWKICTARQVSKE